MVSWLVCLALVLLGVVAVSDQAVAGKALHRALALAADDVATLSGLSADDGDGLAPPGGLPVEVVVDGDVDWLQAQAEAVATDHPAFSPGQGPHQLRFEYVQDGRTWAVRGQLWRKGWSLRPPEPAVARIFPWVVVLAGALGAVLWFRRLPLAIAAAVSAIAAQAGLSAMPWPEALVRPTWSEAIANGPLGRAVTGWARALPEQSVAVGAGVIALCVVLMVFDHRRSRDRGGWALLTGLVTVVCAVVWIEAALRGEVLAWASTGLGALGAAGLVGLWTLPALRRNPAPEPQPEPESDPDPEPDPEPEDRS